MSGELCTNRGSDGTLCLYGAKHAVPCKYGRAEDIEAQCEECDCASSRHDSGTCDCGCRRMRWAGRLTSRTTDRSADGGRHEGRYGITITTRPEQCGHMAPGRKGECSACRAMYVNPLPEPQPMAGLDVMLPPLRRTAITDVVAREWWDGKTQEERDAIIKQAMAAVSRRSVPPDFSTLVEDVGYVRRGLMQALGEIPAEKVPPAFRLPLCRHGKALCETCDANPPRLHLVGTEEPKP